MVLPEVLPYSLIPVAPMRDEGSPILTIQHMPHRLQDMASLNLARTTCLWEL